MVEKPELCNLIIAEFFTKDPAQTLASSDGFQAALRLAHAHLGSVMPLQGRTRRKGGTVTGWVWAGIFIGVAIVILAVGIPYVTTHKGMRAPYDRSEAGDYLRAKRRWRRGQHTRPGRPERAASRRGGP